MYCNKHPAQIKIALKLYHWVHVSDSVKTSTVRFFIFSSWVQKKFSFLLSISFFSFSVHSIMFNILLGSDILYDISLLILTSNNSSICRIFRVERQIIFTFLAAKFCILCRYFAKFRFREYFFFRAKIVKTFQVSRKSSNYLCFC